MKNVQGRPGSNHTTSFATLRRFLPSGTIPTSHSRRWALISLLGLSLSLLSLVVVEVPVSATSNGTTSLVESPYSALALTSQSTSTPSSTAGNVRVDEVSLLNAAKASHAVAKAQSSTQVNTPSSHVSTVTTSKGTTKSSLSTPPPTTTTVPPTTTTTTTSTTSTASGNTTPTPTTTTTVPPTTTTTTTPPVRAVTQRLSNPSANIIPSPNFLQSGQCTTTAGSGSCTNPCVTSALKWPVFSNDPGCTNYILQAINTARGDEGLSTMTLPSNWFSLSQDQQLFVVANLERTARGLPPYIGLNAALSANAQHAAATNSDPSLASGFSVGNDAQGSPGMGGAWAGGFSVLAADYMWMYDDGWGGSAAATSNVACTSSGASGCWAHRDELLGSDPGFNPGVGLNCTDCEMGTGFAVVGGSSSFADLIELPSAAPPAMTFTWSQELSEGF